MASVDEQDYSQIVIVTVTEFQPFNNDNNLNKLWFSCAKLEPSLARLSLSLTSFLLG